MPGTEKLFTISEDGASITCHHCNLTSHHPEDVRNRYCAACNVFHDDAALYEAAVFHEEQEPTIDHVSIATASLTSGRARLNLTPSPPFRPRE